ncbi:GNAT family N-acetyltransferase [Streptomyces albus]|uniref:GNAT family N-acetyltransferase n=1 Tax=Streptomyces albus TaxID=1888 RepID=UPI0033FE3A1E
MSDEVRIRAITDADWDRIAELERRTYLPLGLSEGQAALRSKAEVSPETCFVLTVGSRPGGYLVALPFPPFDYPDLYLDPTTTRQPVSGSRNLHLHDLVVAPRLRRRGLAQRLLHHLTRTALARGYEQISLVAVGRSQRFWAARGFTPQPAAGTPAGYGKNAVYMSRALPAAGQPTRRPARHRAAGPCPTK